MAKHKHQSILQGAAEELLSAGKINTFDAVYKWVCPDCGLPQRTTRLADTIYALRHAYGWQIDTLGEWQDEQTLATYTLVKAGDMPGDTSKGPHPRQLVRDNPTHDITAGLVAEAAIGIHKYDGKPIPVEAIPSPTRWQCVVCGVVVVTPPGQPQLGGYRIGKHCLKKSNVYFRPVV